MWGMMKQWIKAGGAIDPKDEELYQDLIGPETVATLDGVIQLESKDGMKERGMPSPNRADALALTFAEPVAKRSVPVGANNHSSAQVEYNPLNPTSSL
jgi:hypothetical protein